MKILKTFETIIIWILVALMAVVLTISIIQMIITIIDYLVGQPFELFNDTGMMGLIGSILVVLIGIELLDTIKTYLREDVVRVEIILLVAVIALAKKIIVLDISSYSGEMLLGLAALLIALGLGYYLIKHADHKYSLRLPQKAEKEK